MSLLDHFRRRARIFVSYSRQDAELAESLRELLAARRFEVFLTSAGLALRRDSIPQTSFESVVRSPRRGPLKILLYVVGVLLGAWGLLLVVRGIGNVVASVDQSVESQGSAFGPILLAVLLIGLAWMAISKARQS